MLEISEGSVMAVRRSEDDCASCHVTEERSSDSIVNDRLHLMRKAVPCLGYWDDQFLFEILAGSSFLKVVRGIVWLPLDI